MRKIAGAENDGNEADRVSKSWHALFSAFISLNALLDVGEKPLKGICYHFIVNWNHD